MYVKIDKDSFEVIIITANLKIVGTIHTLPQERLTDFMAESTTDYLPVTNATIHLLKDDTIIAKTKFFSMSRKDVTLIFPVTEMIK
jgi:hypothetical protein